MIIVNNWKLNHLNLRELEREINRDKLERDINREPTLPLRNQTTMH